MFGVGSDGFSAADMEAARRLSLGEDQGPILEISSGEGDSDDFPAADTQRAMENSQDEGLQMPKTPTPGISSKRIRTVVNEALESIGQRPVVVNLSDRILDSINCLYNNVGKGKFALFRTYFVALTVLAYQRAGNQMFFGSYLLLLCLNSLGAFVLLRLTTNTVAEGVLKSIKSNVSSVSVRIKKHVFKENERVEVIFSAVNIIKKVGYILACATTTIIFNAYLFFGSVELLMSIQALEISAIMMGLSVRGIYLGTKHVYEEVRKAQHTAFLKSVNPNRFKKTRTQQHLKGLSNLDKCGIRFSHIKLPGRLSGCKHVFELSAIIEWLQSKETCPTCRAKVADGTDNHLVFVDRTTAKDITVSGS